MNKMDEMIVVAPRTTIFNGEKDAFQGVTHEHSLVNRVLKAYAGANTLKRRGDVEEDPSLKQLIPYVALVRDRNGVREVYAYERLQGGGETRLHSRLSVGVGGHMNTPLDEVGYQTVLFVESFRELNEELSFSPSLDKSAFPFKIHGLINDDSDAVGQVHLGVLCVVTLDMFATVTVQETEQLKGRWMPLSEALEAGTLERFEKWSQFSLAALSD